MPIGLLVNSFPCLELTVHSCIERSKPFRNISLMHNIFGTFDGEARNMTRIKSLRSQNWISICPITFLIVLPLIPKTLRFSARKIARFMQKSPQYAKYCLWPMTEVLFAQVSIRKLLNDSERFDFYVKCER